MRIIYLPTQSLPLGSLLQVFTYTRKHACMHSQLYTHIHTNIHIHKHTAIEETLEENTTKPHTQVDAVKQSQVSVDYSTKGAQSLEGKGNNSFLVQDLTHMKAENKELLEKLQTLDKEYQEYKRKQGRWIDVLHTLILYTYTYMRTYIHTFTHMYAYINSCSRIYYCNNKFVFSMIKALTQPCVSNMLMLLIYVCVYVCICMYVYIYIYIYIYIYMCVCVYACMYV